ncbi:right-handed parallel beta-helix repeat-containing protein [Priestia megaterium]|uniref:right-handed parallel beta-helix repeat-containing protein n=1 Tax=Priestia megaterium TaxID=1404 RepID=UPI003D03D3FA
MARTDWTSKDTVRPADMNQIGQEINDLQDAVSNINIPDASLTDKGIVQLSNATDGIREDVAPTEKALKAAYERGSMGVAAAAAAQDTANAAETPGGAQAKADEALGKANQYTDQQVGAITKTSLGLENVANYMVATQAEAEAGTAADKYMTPQRVSQAITKLAGDQRAATVVIAASNASEASKRGADYVCNGVDDQVVINNVLYDLLSGGEVVLTEGTFIVNSSIRIPSNTTFRGSGLGTVIKLQDNSAYSATLLTNEYNPARGIVVSDLTLDGNKSNNPNRSAGGISLTQVEDCHIQRLLVIGMTFGMIQVIEGQYISIQENIIRNNPTSTASIDVLRTNYSTVNNNIIADNGSSGISFDGSYLSISGNVIRGTGSDSISIDGSNSRVEGNIIVNSGRHGITIDGSYNSVQNNVIRGSVENGVMVYSGATSNLVTNNDMYGHGSKAIYDIGTGTITTAGNRM